MPSVEEADRLVLTEGYPVRIVNTLEKSCTPTYTSALPHGVSTSKKYCFAVETLYTLIGGISLKKISLAIGILAGIAMMSSCGMTNTPHRLGNTPSSVIRDDRAGHRDGLMGNHNGRRHDGQHNNGVARQRGSHNAGGFLNGIFGNRNQNNRDGVRDGNHSATMGYNHSRANKLATRVKDIEGVENAVVTINGNTAMVGLNVKDGHPEAEIAKLKTQVRHAIKNTDSNIEHIGVTTAPELVTRMNNEHEKHNTGEHKAHEKHHSGEHKAHQQHHSGHKHRTNKHANNMLPNVMPTV